MPANHKVPHTAEAKAKMSASHSGKPAPWKHRESKVVDGITVYRCGRCAQFFPVNDFHADRRTLLGIKSTCKACHNLVNVASRNPVNKREKAVVYEASRRARKAGEFGTVSAADWRELLKILGNKCLKCGTLEALTQDHIVPLAKGGAHHPSNLQPLCRPCNEKKQARTADYRTQTQRAAIEAKWAIEFKRLKP